MYQPPQRNHDNADKDDRQQIKTRWQGQSAERWQDAGILDFEYSIWTTEQAYLVKCRGPPICGPRVELLEEPAADYSLLASASQQSPKHTNHVKSSSPLRFLDSGCYQVKAALFSIREFAQIGNRQIPRSASWKSMVAPHGNQLGVIGATNRRV